ncbi:MAG TPA: molybdenum cofactor guanylyltransferase [Pyrinomonadaceae bacterium]|jgi:molybdopterin-guanine dinucleotide biosynthesis protein A
MSEIEGFILAGGASSRMGRDKARLSLGQKQFVERIADALRHIADRLSLVGARDPAAAWRWPNVPDVHKSWGALGGLHAALKASRAPWAAVVACDLPFVTGELFLRLAARREGFDAVVPLQMDGRRQPLCALYRVSQCLDQTEKLIAEGERRPRALLDKIRTRLVQPEELADLEGAALFFSNINTPEDYEQAKKGMSDEGGAMKGLE